jgi:hypothetical protein
MSRAGRSRHKKLPLAKFAPIPVDGIKFAASILTAPEFRVWVCLCAQSQQWSNGTANLTRPVIREYHLGSTRTVTQAIRKLIESGLIVQTRKHRQHVCAMFGVTHLPANLDAMEKQGVSATTWEALKFKSSATNSGTAAARPHGKRYCDHIGSAEPLNGPPARPHGNRKGAFSGIPARPQGTQSKNPPSATATESGGEGVLQ